MMLSERLKSIVKMVDKCYKIIDVGTDHAYVPIFLVKNKICKEALASDINKGPLKKAKRNIDIENLNDYIECRLGGGLSVVKPGEVDVAVIAGMGGNLIRDIIENDIDVFKELDYAILQPVQNVDILRKYLYDSGFDILDEEICKEEGKYYEIIKVKYDEKYRHMESIYYEISEILINKKNPLIYEYMKFKLDKYEKIYNTLSEDTENSRKRKKELKYKICALKELI
ncbi:tRNA (adenine(22)-N(1))-methyltransferase [Clostridium tepidiprofundi]|nr:class I SAM-dependent methyltransferase [Clostridium tepidiprofundi]